VTAPSYFMGAFSQGAKLGTGVTETAAELEAAGVTLATTETEGEGEGEGEGASHTPQIAISPQGAGCSPVIAPKLVCKSVHDPLVLPTFSKMYAEQSSPFE